MSGQPTPGPWRVEIDKYGPLDVVGADGEFVARAAWRHRNEKDAANARLIAAAPEMYEYIKVRAERGEETARRLIARSEGRA